MIFDDVGKWYGDVLGGSKRKPGKRARNNPAKFERCVREVKASAKKHGYPLKSAYAVCNAATRKNPAEATEFQRRRDLPYVEVRYFHGKRYNTTELTMRGTTIGSKTDSLKRGKVVSTTYFLPEFQGDPLGHLPIKRRNPRDPRTQRSYSSYGIRHAAGEIAEDVVRHGFSKEWFGTWAEMRSVGEILAPFGIVLSNERRGTWVVEPRGARRNPSVTITKLTMAQKRAVLAFVKTLKRPALLSGRSGRSSRPKALSSTRRTPAREAGGAITAPGEWMRFEFTEGRSNKFWKVRLQGSSFVTHWGRIGQVGQETVKRYGSPAEARSEGEKLIASKIRKGYRLVR